MTQETKTEQWTPGPWEINDTNESGDQYIGPVDTMRYIALAMQNLLEPAEETKANAHLIAAAPDLYTALKNLVARYDEAEINAAIAALAKARGGE